MSDISQFEFAIALAVLGMLSAWAIVGYMIYGHRVSQPDHWVHSSVRGIALLMMAAVIYRASGFADDLCTRIALSPLWLMFSIGAVVELAVAAFSCLLIFSPRSSSSSTH